MTGADGQLGRSLASRLAAAQTIALGRGQLDITDPAAIRRIVAEVEPTVIINAAADNNVDAAEQEPAPAFAVNGQAVAYLAEAARKVDAALVHVSTDYVFDGTKGAPYIETDAPNPISRYGESKLAGEHAVAASLARHIIIRTSWLFSEQPGNFVTRILTAARERERLDVVDDQIGSPTEVGFLADAIARLITHASVPYGVGPGHLLHICNGGGATRFEVAERVLSGSRALGMALAATEIRAIKTGQYPALARRPADSRLATDCLRDRFGIVPPAWESAVDELLGRIASSDH